MVHIWKQCKQAVDAFWNIWRSAYLQSLHTDKQAHRFPHNVLKEEPRVGHVVLIAEKNVKRPSWKIGHILQLNISADGEIRSATLKVGTRTPGLGITKGEIITRLVHHLYLLKLSEEIENVAKNHHSEPQEEIIEIDLDGVF